MREIKFRGKRIDNGEWIEGNLYQEGDTDAFIFTSLTCIDSFMQAYGNSVDPDTVGQYTGLRDKNGKEVYEGDILYGRGEEWCGGHKISDYGCMSVVKWSEDELMWIAFDWYNNESYSLYDYEPTDGIIGNIFENPELMEEQR